MSDAKRLNRVVYDYISTPLAFPQVGSRVEVFDAVTGLTADTQDFDLFWEAEIWAVNRCAELEGKR